MSDKPTIYDQFDKAFQNVSAYVVLDKQGECVAKIAFKFPRDGAGRLYAYVHWLGTQMVRGQASGYGYDKRSAAVANAVRKADSVLKAQAAEFYDALENDGGEYWDTRLRNAGFTVIQAV
ncbi:hypothetical protein [Rhizobium phage RHph_X2_30]|nr:hypothetical protein [Rhizobium phage RHph_X2_30]